MHCLIRQHEISSTTVWTYVVRKKKWKMPALLDYWPRWIWARHFVFGLQPWAQNTWTGAARAAAWSHPTVPGSAFASAQPPLLFSELFHKNRLEEQQVKTGFPISLAARHNMNTGCHILIFYFWGCMSTLSHTHKDSICFSTQPRYINSGQSIFSDLFKQLYVFFHILDILKLKRNNRSTTTALQSCVVTYRITWNYTL